MKRNTGRKLVTLQYQSMKGPMYVSYTVFHDPVGRSSERISLTIDLLGRETQCKRHTLVLSLIVTALLSVYHWGLSTVCSEDFHLHDFTVPESSWHISLGVEKEQKKNRGRSPCLFLLYKTKKDLLPPLTCQRNTPNMAIPNSPVQKLLIRIKKERWTLNSGPVIALRPGLAACEVTLTGVSCHKISSIRHATIVWTIDQGDTICVTGMYNENLHNYHLARSDQLSRRVWLSSKPGVPGRWPALSGYMTNAFSCFRCRWLFCRVKPLTSKTIKKL